MHTKHTYTYMVRDGERGEERYREGALGGESESQKVRDWLGEYLGSK